MGGAPRTETFRTEQRRDGLMLVRRCEPSGGFSGQTYEHRCDLATFEAVAHACEEARAGGFCLEELQAATQRPHSRCGVSLAFLKERGIVETKAGRRAYCASPSVHIDAMCEIHALHEEIPA